MRYIHDMCVNCVSHSEMVVGEVALAVAFFREPCHRLLATLGLVTAPVLAARDARTVTFLRSLELDAAEVLGSTVVAEADAWVAGGQVRPGRCCSLALTSWWPIRSHKRLAAA
jgi:hypothetical protein